MRFTPHAIGCRFWPPCCPIALVQPRLDFKPGHGFCIPNPRNDRAAQRQRAASKRRNKSKRG